MVGACVGEKDTEGCCVIVGLFVGGDEGAVDGLGDGAFVGTVATKFWYEYR